MKIKKFYMVRHGQSESNAAGVAAGFIDSPLSALGRAQAKDVGRLIESQALGIDRIVCSPLLRARQTAEIINQALNLPLQINNDIAEQSFGDWQGVGWDIINPLIAQNVQPPNGETNIEFQRRIMKGFAAVLAMPGTVLVVAHGGTFQSLGTHYGVDLRNVENCRLYEFQPVESGQFPWTIGFYDLQAVKQDIHINTLSNN